MFTRILKSLKQWFWIRFPKMALKVGATYTPKRESFLERWEEDNRAKCLIVEIGKNKVRVKELRSDILRLETTSKNYLIKEWVRIS